jgi:hypothetical protein
MERDTLVACKTAIETDRRATFMARRSSKFNACWLLAEEFIGRLQHFVRRQATLVVRIDEVVNDVAVDIDHVDRGHRIKNKGLVIDGTHGK